MASPLTMASGARHAETHDCPSTRSVGGCTGSPVDVPAILGGLCYDLVGAPSPRHSTDCWPRPARTACHTAATSRSRPRRRSATLPTSPGRQPRCTAPASASNQAPPGQRRSLGLLAAGEPESLLSAGSNVGVSNGYPGGHGCGSWVLAAATFQPVGRSPSIAFGGLRPMPAVQKTTLPVRELGPRDSWRLSA
jgi:hypothetical protein